MTILGNIGRLLASFLSREGHVHDAMPRTNLEQLRQALRPGDVLLVDGNSMVATAVKYLTQSTWSHAALYVGRELGLKDPEGVPLDLIEADLVAGVRAVSLNLFAGFHCRICRPAGLTDDGTARAISYARARLGNHYDLRNIFDLVRYFFPTPPVPTRWRRRMIAFGSGDPTRAICSGLIAQAFEAADYPILVGAPATGEATNVCNRCHAEVQLLRKHNLYVPRDFDVSPRFVIIKPHTA